MDTPFSSIRPFFFKRYITFHTEESEVPRICFAMFIVKIDLFSSSRVNNSLSSLAPNFMFCVVTILFKASIVTQILICVYSQWIYYIIICRHSF